MWHVARLGREGLTVPGYVTREQGEKNWLDHSEGDGSRLEGLGGRTDSGCVGLHSN